MTPLPPLVVITGPTAVGKTALSLALSQRLRGEVVSADSRQIYRGMDIGTAKPTPAEQAAAPHHLLDLRDPDQSLSLAEYQELAYAIIDDIHRRGGLPLLVGGSALYVRGVVHGLRIPDVPPNPALRAELEDFAAQHGHEALFTRLQAADPVSAARMDGRNVRRVVRALEIFLESGRPKSELEGVNPPPYRILQIGLDRERASLYARIGQRVAQMIEQGLIHETQRLLDAGYPPTLPAMTSLGYREIGQYLAGELSLAQAVERIEIETHRFVRHQYSWFRRMEGIHWVNADLPHREEVLNKVTQFVDSPSSL